MSTRTWTYAEPLSASAACSTSGIIDRLRSLALEGRLLVIGFTGCEITTVKVNRLLLINVSVVGVVWGGFLMHRPDDVLEQWQSLSSPLGSWHRSRRCGRSGRRRTCCARWTCAP